MVTPAKQVNRSQGWLTTQVNDPDQMLAVRSNPFLPANCIFFCVMNFNTYIILGIERHDYKVANFSSSV